MNLQTTGESRARLSVIVPAFNCQGTIAGCLAAIRSSSRKDYELIVADDGSTDATGAIAAKYADRLLTLPHAGRIAARENGFQAATGQILVNIDSDILIQPDTLAIISDFFQANPGVDALTGRLSMHTPVKGFFSQYKNLYMHHIFGRLPERVTFLYGSIYAVRAALWNNAGCAAQKSALTVELGEDTAMGQSYAASGRQIAFLKDLQVTHLKTYTLRSFIANDFNIPFWWAHILIATKGWKQLGKSGTGYSHSPKEQLASVVLAPLLALLLPLTAGGLLPAYAPPALGACWLLLNIRFLAFLNAQKGLFFALQAACVTFLDNIIMAAGVACGTLHFIFSRGERSPVSE
ncbi:MAG: hypothetical protein A2285_02200 [Elusimicrobia bacterium RIFOXYA12_FULL_57_11]|nr:MAG: hypothetical protein A2285_02200 [Elusimicrobia bacterium RIFOXYA12_FULL_57_11]